MKKFIFRAAAAIALLFTAFSAGAQEPQPVPTDSAVLVGRLPNGLTYYIRHNEMPKGQADFFIAQKVGSVLEDEEQRGLAHFLEHMCFNGTQNFPGNGLIDWLETVGVKFGQNLNAYTGFDETVYNISSVPVKREGVIDSCLLILHDWADGLLLDPEEIDKERGVIHQEWRRSNVGQMRILEQLLPKIYPGSKYGERLPIGLMSVVDNFKPQVLRDYYEKWYRPDNQAIIVVGDIDPAAIEQKIKTIFDPIKVPENLAPRYSVQVPDNQGTIYAIGADKEMKLAVAYFFFKLPEQLLNDETRRTMAYYPIEYMKYMIGAMVNSRLEEMSQKPDCPFAGASIEIGDYMVSPTKDALTLQVIGKGDDIRPAFEAAYREVLRACRGGFTKSEFDRAKAEYLSKYEKAYEQRDGRNNTSYAREYAANYTKGDPIPGALFELEMAKAVANMIPMDAFNKLLPEIVNNKDNRVFMALLPEKDGYHQPTEEEIAASINKVEGEEIEAYTEEVRTDPLVPALYAPATPKVSHNDIWDATELQYPNGVKVIIKPTTFKPGEILFDATARGGYGHENVSGATLSILRYALSNYGLGEYSYSDLQKYLQGKNTHTSFGISANDRTLSGSTTPKNLKVLMELINMSFRDVRIAEDDFAALQAQLEAVLANQEATPDFKAQQGWSKSLYKRGADMLPTAESVKAANREEIQSLIHTMYANPADFTFSFVGDVNVDSLTALCNQYIGNLTAPRIAGVPTTAAADFEPFTGEKTTNESMKMQTPQTYVYITLSGKVPYTAKNRMATSVAGQILSNRLLKKIREEMGAVYSIGAAAQLDRMDDQNFFLYIPFPMKPELKQQVLDEIHKMTFDMAENITDEEFLPIKEFMVKSAKENAEKNNAWLGGIGGYALNGINTFTNAEEVANALTKDDVKALLKDVFGQKNYRIYVLDPAE